MFPGDYENHEKAPDICCKRRENDIFGTFWCACSSVLSVHVAPVSEKKERFRHREGLRLYNDVELESLFGYYVSDLNLFREDVEGS